MPHLTDQELIERTHNTSRFFVEHRQIAWAALVFAVAWGTNGYFSMPQRKDPEIPVRVAVASCQWPGATAQEVEQLVTRPIEQTIAENKHIHPATPDEYGIRSISLPGLSIVYVQLAENVSEHPGAVQRYQSEASCAHSEVASRRIGHPVSKRFQRHGRPHDDGGEPAHR